MGQERGVVLNISRGEADDDARKRKLYKMLCFSRL